VDRFSAILARNEVPPVREGHFFPREPMIEQSQNESPEIRIDRDGVWYYRNIEMTRKEIVQYFVQHLQRDSRGHYQIELGCEHCRIQVDDVPYIIRSVSSGFTGVDGRMCMIISLSDGSCEELNPETIRIGENNVPYCRVKRSGHEARFSRQAYYQLAENIEYDSHQDRYFMTVDSRSYPIAVNQTTENGGSHVR
jgi:uncharacterized protein